MDGSELNLHSSVSHGVNQFNNLHLDEASVVARGSHQVLRESSTRWSNFDSHVSCIADCLRPQQFKLPWESGYAGMVLSNKMPKLCHAIGDDPMQVGRADFIRATVSISCCTVTQVAWSCQKTEVDELAC